MRGWLGLAARLYPKAWRDRYAREFDALLDGFEPRWSDVWDVLRGAAMMQARAWSSYLKLAGAMTVAGAIAAIVVSFLLPGRYVSSAVVQAGRADDPQTLDRILYAWQDVMSRSSLSEVIQRPNLDLYKSERNRQPLEDVIKEMKKKDVKIEILKDRGEAAFRVSFVYPNRYKAQAVVDVLTTKVREASRARWTADPATLPKAPAAPDRMAFLFWGLGVGLLAGVLASCFRWRAMWTMKVIGFGVAGCVITAGLAWLIPNRYTSSCTLRVVPAPKADGVQRYMQEAEMAAWLQKKHREILSDANLYEIIQRPALNLYPKDRADKPVEEVVGMMRRNLSVEAPHSHAAFTIAFTYPDRFKAQATVAALVTKFTDSEIVVTEADLMAYHPPARRGMDDCIGKTGDSYASCITGYLGPVFPSEQKARRRQESESLDLLDAPSLPETPVAPNRFILAGAGLLVGLFVGAYAQQGEPAAGLRRA